MSPTTRAEAPAYRAWIATSSAAKEQTLGGPQRRHPAPAPGGVDSGETVARIVQIASHSVDLTLGAAEILFELPGVPLANFGVLAQVFDGGVDRLEGMAAGLDLPPEVAEAGLRGLEGLVASVDLAPEIGEVGLRGLEGMVAGDDLAPEVGEVSLRGLEGMVAGGDLAPEVGEVGLR